MSKIKRGVAPHYTNCASKGTRSLSQPTPGPNPGRPHPGVSVRTEEDWANLIKEALAEAEEELRQEVLEEAEEQLRASLAEAAEEFRQEILIEAEERIREELAEAVEEFRHEILIEAEERVREKLAEAAEEFRQEILIEAEEQIRERFPKVREDTLNDFDERYGISSDRGLITLLASISPLAGEV